MQPALMARIRRNTARINEVERREAIYKKYLAPDFLTRPTGGDPPGRLNIPFWLKIPKKIQKK